MATLSVPVTIDFSSTALNNITEIAYGAFNANGTFANTQFDNVQIKTNATVTGQFGFAHGLIVNGGSIDATSWIFNGWDVVMGSFVELNGAGGADTIRNSAVRDTISGNNNADIIYGGGGFSQGDTLNGNAGNDTFRYRPALDAIVDTISGGIGNADKIRITDAGAYDFSGAIISSVERFEFANMMQTATLRGSHTGATGSITAIRGSNAANTLDVSGSADMSGVAFTNWSATADLVSFHGTALNDTQVGTGFNDIFHGSSGLDSHEGRLGDDTFQIAVAPIISNSFNTYDGGGGYDTIHVAGTGSVDFFNSTIIGVERLTLDAELGNAYLRGRHFAVGGIAEVQGTVGKANNLRVDASFLEPDIDLSGVIFTNWDDNEDTVSIWGENGISRITGSVRNDEFAYILNADTLNGHDGDDTFFLGGDIYNPALSIDGGNGGRDRIVLTSNPGGTDDLSAISLANVELLEFSGQNGSVILSDQQIGRTGTILIVNDVDNSVFRPKTLAVNGAATDLRAVVFETWRDSTSHVILNGSVNGDVLYGSSRADEILGSDGDDILSGGGGDDIVDAGIGIDTVFGSAGADDLDGSSNTDTLDYSASPSGVIVDIAANTASGGDAEGDTIAGFERLIGSAFDDTLTGSGLANRITGGAGLDQLTGGGAADVFDYNDAGESTSALRDFITDFEDASLDKIDLIHIDADAVAAGNNTFALTASGGTAGFTNLGQLRYFIGTQNTTVSLNISGDTAPDMQIVLAGQHTLDAADFVL